MGDKQVKRASVMVGGGAKGFYEVGVMFAYHLLDLEFDVITGSSAGALVSTCYAEFLYRKKLSKENGTPDDSKEVMNALLRAWLDLPSYNLFPDKEGSLLHDVVDTIKRSNITVGELVDLAWTWSTPDDQTQAWQKLYSTFSGMYKVGNEVLTLLGQQKNLFEYFNKRGFGKGQQLAPPAIFAKTLDYYLVEQVGFDQALVQQKAHDTFMQHFITGHKLDSKDIHADRVDAASKNDPVISLIPADRKLSEYAKKGIDVRVTRTNYRTGRLEISGYFTTQDFVHYLIFLFSRLRHKSNLGREVIPVGYTRIKLPGDPNAIWAALASSRFPAAFKPVKYTEIYPDIKEDVENTGEMMMVAHTEEESMLQVQKDIVNLMQPENLEGKGEQSGGENPLYYPLFYAYQSLPDKMRQRAEDYVESFWEATGVPANLPSDGDDKDVLVWKTIFNRVNDLLILEPDKKDKKGLFPSTGDIYIDGGAVDNVPTRTAINAVQEAVDMDEDSCPQDVELDLFVTYLEPEPKIEEDVALEPGPLTTAMRAMDIVSTATMSSDVSTVGAFNSITSKANKIIKEFEDFVLEHHSEKELRSVQARLNIHKQKLPILVNTVNIYPDDNKPSLPVLGFSERFGFNMSTALGMITSGCSNTLWQVFEFITLKNRVDNAEDQAYLDEAHKYIQLPEMISNEVEGACTRKQLPHTLKKIEHRMELREKWRCAHLVCPFYELCPKGGEKAGA